MLETYVHRKHLLCRLCGVLTVAATLASTAPAFGAERMMLGEYFTATWCSLCQTAGPVVSDMIDEYPDTLAVIEYHQLDAYATPFGDDRGLFYDDLDGGMPWFAYDGLSNAFPIETYEPDFIARQSVPTTVTLSVGAEQIVDETYGVTARVCMEPESPQLALRLYVVVVQDRYPPNSHYRNTFRMAADTEDIILAGGQCHTFDREITMEASWDHENLKIIAWAQRQAPIYPAEVEQAAKCLWPFEALPILGDWDNDGQVNLDDHSGLAACMGGPDPVSAPTELCQEVFDADLDGDIDLQDYAEFLSEFDQP